MAASLLPSAVTPGDYWGVWHPEPVDRWRPALDAIRSRHGLPADDWARFPRGRNAVFALGERLVVKLVPPLWTPDAAREAAALVAVWATLPVTTPELLAVGEIDGWSYFVQRRLPGTVLADIWASLDSAQRQRVAHQQGRIMRALHDLPPPDAPALRFDWVGLLVEQALQARDELERAGLTGTLLADLSAYLDARRLSWAAPVALLHGDLDAINLLVEQQGADWSITGLVDWSDAKIGPVTHEFISPGVHTLRGDRAALRAWIAGYGLPATREEFQHQVMARAILYYPDTLPKLLARVDGAATATSWHDVARAFWRMTDVDGA
jgi:hygromycin-B 7''-O-kinase